VQRHNAPKSDSFNERSLVKIELIQGVDRGFICIFLLLLQQMVQLLNHHRVNSFNSPARVWLFLFGGDANVFADQKARQTSLH
jgi:hypothetical protein